MNKLEKDYFAEIDAWKQRKEDEDYQAKKKAEEDFWAAQDKLMEFWPQAEKICKLADKCYSYNINIGNWFYTSIINKISLIKKSLYINHKYEDHFFVGMRHFNNSELIITENGLEMVSSCTGFIRQDGKIFASNVNEIINQLPKFITEFYKKLDEILKN